MSDDRRVGVGRVIGVLAVVMIGVSCGRSDNDELQQASPPVTTDAGPTSERQRLYIDADTVECVGEIPQQCLVVATSPDSDGEFFYDSIEGFDHVAGTRYVIEVEVIEVTDAPADTSAVRYQLIDIVDARPGDTIDPSPPLANTQWKLTSPADLAGDDITIEFSADQLSGSAGCNDYEARFTDDSSDVSIGEVRTTLMRCGGAVDEREATYFEALQDTLEAEIDVDGTLTLRGGSTTLAFDPVAQ